MTYRDLLKELKGLSPSQLDQEITVHIAGTVTFLSMKSVIQMADSDDDGNEMEATVVLQTNPDALFT
jgi:hypothetical protein